MSDIDVLRKIEIELRDKIARLESEITRLRNDIEVMRNALKYYSDECDAGCFADWGERAKIALDTIEAALKEGK